MAKSLSHPKHDRKNRAGERGRMFLFQALAGMAMAAMFILPSFAPPSTVSFTVTPYTWNIIGLDSNTPVTGPNRFPVGARVCNTGSSSASSVTADFVWDDATATYIYSRAGSAVSLSLATLAASECKDAYFEVEVSPDATSFDKTRRYHIAVSGSDGTSTITASSPQPRELYVEHLISQNRNSVTDIKLADINTADISTGTSIPAGGSMNLMVGKSYKIGLYGGTATQGYNQFEAFINIPNTILQILAVSTTYSASTNPSITNPYPRLYADACGWENDPNSPNYRSCVGGDYKAGGSNVVTVYSVKVISGSGTNQPLNSLLYDFSGSSFHYNADYSTGARIVNIVDSSSVTIAKSFVPKAIDPSTVPAGTSQLTFRIYNPTTETISKVNFTDTFPTNMTTANTTTSTSNCGSPTLVAPIGAGSFSASAASIGFSNGTLAPNTTCTITVHVMAPAGSYTNKTGNLFIEDTIDTTRYGEDTLLSASAGGCTPGQPLASWAMNPSSTSVPPTYTSKAANVNSAAATATVSNSLIDAANGNPVNSWSGTGFDKTATITGDSTPYFQFAVDTSQYSSVKIALDYRQDASWSTPSTVYVWSSTTGSAGSFNKIFESTSFDTTFRSTGERSASSTGSSMTYFRIIAVGANNKQAAMQIDNIAITGCGVPAAPAPSISKSFTPSTIVKGATSTLGFSIANTANGNVDLSGISFSDVLPAGLSVADSSVTQCSGTLSVASSTRKISLSNGSLAPNGSCTFDVTVTGTTEGSYDNVTGFISSNEGGASTNYATAALKVIAPPVLSKAFSPPSIKLNGTSTLTFTITNPNQQDSLGVLGFSDTLPDGLTAGNGTTSSLCGSGTMTVTGTNTIVFAGGSLAANSSCTFSVTVTGTTTGTKTNTTDAISFNEEYTGNTASATLLVSNPVSLLGLKKEISLDNVNWFKSVGISSMPQNVYYRFTIANEGETALAGISVTDPGVSVCTLPPTLEIGATSSCITGPISVTAAPSPNPFVNTATATTTTYTPATAITSSARYGTKSLSLEKSATETYFSAAGDVLHYSYKVTNNGGYPLLGPVTVSDNKATVTCPAVSTVGDLDSYLDVGEYVTCTASYTIVAGDLTTGSVTNTATAAANGATSPQASKTVTAALADLSITKTDGVASVLPGQSLTYTIVAGNSGPAAVTGVTVADTFPASLINITWTCAASTGASCPASGVGNISTSAVNLPSGGTATFTVSAMVSSSIATVSLSNTATISAPSGITDPNPGNNSATDLDSVIPAADLSIAKTHSPTSPVPGQSMTYTITVTNLGPSAVTGATVADTLPAVITGAAWTCAASTGASCPASGNGNISTSAVNLPSGGTATFTVTGTLSASATGTVTNTATVAAPTGTTDPTPANNSATDNSTPAPQADLSIAKTHSPATLVPGQSMTYTITVTNLGPSAVTGATVADTLPAVISGAAWTCAASTGASCPAGASGNISTSAVNLPPGGTATFTVTGTLSASATGTVTNTATVAAPSGTTDPTPANNSATDNGSPSPQADLSIAKTHSPTTPVPGQSMTYTITVTNAGPSAVTGATVADALPAVITGASWTCAASTGASCPASGSGNIATSAVNLPSGGTATFTVTGTLSASATGTVTNTATVAAPTGTTDPTPANNSATDNSTPAPQADLSIAKTHSPAALVPGQSMTYTITVTNAGPSAVTGATVADTLPAVITGASWTCAAAGSGASCPAAGSGNIATSAVNLPPGGTAVFTVTGTLSASATGTVTNTATVAAPSGTTDPTPANNSATDSTTIGPQADLSITKTHSPAVLTPGQSIGYTITVTNAGPSAVTGATVADTLPAVITGASWTCAAAGSGASCPAGGSGNIATSAVNLPSGGTATFTVTGTLSASATGTVTNTATVAVPSGTADPTPANNTATDSTAIGPRADLSITKTDGVTTINIGQNLTYTIVVSNAGPSAVTGAPVADTIPSVLTGASWTCTPAGGAACGAGSGSGNISQNVNLPVGGSVTFSVRAQVGSSASGSISNTATVAAPSGVTDPTPANNTATDTDTVAGGLLAPVGIKTVSGDGNPELTWRMVWINSRNSVALLTRITDTVPAGTTYVGGSVQCEARGSSAGTGCRYDAARNAIVWDGTIGADSGATNEANAANELVLTFRTTLNSGTTTVQNQGAAQWDANRSGSVEDDITGGQAPVVTDDSSTASPGDPTRWARSVPQTYQTPTLTEWGFILLALMQALIAVYFLRK